MVETLSSGIWGVGLGVLEHPRGPSFGARTEGYPATLYIRLHRAPNLLSQSDGTCSRRSEPSGFARPPLLDPGEEFALCAQAPEPQSPVPLTMR